MIFKAMDNEGEWNLFEKLTHVIKCGDYRGLVVRHDNGRVAAMAVCDSFTAGNGCNVHLAIIDPFVLRHGFLEEISRYVFIERECLRLFSLVAANNLKSLKLTRHIGMTELTRIPNGIGDGVDYVVMGLERDDCRWIQEKAA